MTTVYSGYKKMFDTIVAALTSVMVLITPALALQAPSDSNDFHTLSDYIRYALLNNPEVESYFQGWKAALEQVPQAKALDDPKFTYSYFVEEVETRVGPQRQKFGIMQVFPWFGEIEARGDAATAKANAAGQRYETAKLKLFQQVKDAYYEFAYLATAIDIAKENLELLKHFEEVARTKYRASTATHPDIIRAQMELARLEDILKSLEKLKEPTVARLNSILNRKSDTELPWPSKEQPIEIELNRKVIIEQLITANPELAELNWEVEAAKAEVELAKKKFYPDIGVGVDWIQTDSAMSTGVRDSGKDPVVLMFSMNIPLWHDSYKAAERQAQANVSKYQRQKIDKQNKTIFQALQVIYDIEDSKRKMDLYGNVLVSKSEELVQSSESAYRAGTIDFLSLIDAQRMLLKYQLNYHRALTDNQQNIAKLEALTGQQI
ncbi:MAG: TolC family protein [Sedimentisphaerales bacterium]|nr:TolC family protein [Sedimentisphaerales bacterium]